VLLLDGRINDNFASSCLLQLRLWQRLAQIVLSLLQGPARIFLGSWLVIALDLRSRTPGLLPGWKERRTEEKAGRRFIRFWDTFFGRSTRKPWRSRFPSGVGAAVDGQVRASNV
jgi:hypothetical protein